MALEIEQHWSSGLASLGWIVGLGISKRHVFVGDRNKKGREKYRGLNLALYESKSSVLLKENII